MGIKFNHFLIPWATFHPLSLLHPRLWISPWHILPSEGLDPVDDTIICVNISHGERGDAGLAEPGDIPNQSNLTCSSTPSCYPSPLPMATISRRSLGDQIMAPTKLSAGALNRIDGVLQSLGQDEVENRQSLTPPTNPHPFNINGINTFYWLSALHCPLASTDVNTSNGHSSTLQATFQKEVFDRFFDGVSDDTNYILSSGCTLDWGAWWDAYGTILYQQYY